MKYSVRVHDEAFDEYHTIETHTRVEAALEALSHYRSNEPEYTFILSVEGS